METPTRIEIEAGAALVMTWPDGLVTQLSAPALRAACECATCLGPEGSGSWIGDAASVRIIDASIVGAYALNFTFGPDQHSTGIFPFDRLRALGEATVPVEE
jgi:DUF971 family protein